MQPISYFLLALLVFILAAAMLILYDRLKRSRNADEGGTIKEKEQRLFKLYQNLEDMMLSMEEYVDETKEELARERDALQREWDGGERVRQAPPTTVPMREEAAHDTKAQPAQSTHAAKQKKGGKVEDVRRLNNEGLQEETIAKALGLSRGEVSLILGMLKN